MWVAFLLAVLQILHKTTDYPRFHCQVSVVIFYNGSPFGTVTSLLYIVMPTSQMFRNLRIWNPSLKVPLHVLLNSLLWLMQTTPVKQTNWKKDLVNSWELRMPLYKPYWNSLHRRIKCPVWENLMIKWRLTSAVKRLWDSKSRMVNCLCL